LSLADCSYEVEQLPCELIEVYDLVCLFVDGEHGLSDMDMVEWPMVAMDMPTAAAVWDMWEWSTEAVERETEATDVAEAGNDLHHDHCFYPCHGHHDHCFGHHDQHHCCCCCGGCAVERELLRPRYHQEMI